MSDATPHLPAPRRHRKRRLAMTVGLVVTSLAIAVAAFAWWTLDTQHGAEWAFERLGAALPGDLKVERTRGPIRGPLEIHGLVYQTERAKVVIDRLRLDWKLRALAKQRLDIRALDAEGVHVTLFPRPVPLPKDSVNPELPDVDLPLDFMVKRGLVKRIEITPAGADSAFVLDEVRLADAAFRDTLTIGSMTVKSKRFDLALAGRGYTRGRYGADMDVDWTYRPPRGAALEGRGRIAGDLDTLHVVQNVTGAYRVSFTGAAYRPLRDLTFQGVVDFTEVPIRDLVASMPEGRASGRAQVRGNVAHVFATGEVDARIAEYGRWNAVFEADRDSEHVHLERVVLTSRDRPSRVVARGTVVTRGRAPHVDVVADWNALAWPLVGRPQVTSRDGSARVTGPIEQYRVAAEAALATDQRELGRWRIAGTGDTGGLRLGSVTGQALGGSFTGRGTIDWSPAIAWQLALVARGLDAREFHGDLEGTLGFDVRTRGSSGRGGVRGEMAFDTLTGALRGRPVWGEGSVSFAPGTWSVPTFHLGWGPNLLAVTGDVGREWNLAWNLDAPDLTGTLPYAGGALAMTGSVGGVRDRPHVLSTLRADSLRWQDGRITNLAGDADLDLGRGGRVRVDFVSGPMQIAGRQFTNATLKGEGTREDHGVALVVAANQDSLTLGARGGLVPGEWRGRLQKLDLVSRQIGPWSLEREAPLTASLSSATLDDFCWHSGTGRWCAEAVWRRDAWDLRSTLDNVPLLVFEPWMPATVDLTGPMSGTIAMHGANGRLTGDARLALGPGTMAYSKGSAPIHPSTLTLVADGAFIETDARLSFAAGDTIHARMRTPQGVSDASGRVMDGTLHVRMNDLGFVQAFVPELANSTGQVTADLTLAGTTGRPRWYGSARLAGGVADVPHLGLHLHEVDLDAKSDANGRLDLRGSARSGPGRIELAGDADVAPNGIHRAQATLKGDRFQVSNSREASVLVSPALEAQLTGDSLRLTGEVVVPEAEIRPRPRQTRVVRPSPDVVFVDTLTSDAPPRRAITTYSEVRLTLGRDVWVRAYGLDALVAGNILVIDRPNLPAMGSGEFSVVRGAYRAYGQNLTIDRGRMLFAGPITNPGLDVRASRRARDGVIAGFEVTGKLAEPTFTVFSEPAMAQRDALAYVILGHRIERGNQSQDALVTEAANALSIGGGSLIAGKLASQLGIDEAQIESQGGFKDASLMLGTYLSPRLYVNYGVGLVDPASTLRIQYFLTKRWTLLAETGDESRADILFSVER